MNDRNKAKDNAELCDLLLSEYKKAKPKLSNKQKQNQYFSVLLNDIPEKYKTHFYSLGGNGFQMSDEGYLDDTYKQLLSDMGIEVYNHEVTVFGKTLHYLNVYYGDFKYKEHIG